MKTPRENYLAALRHEKTDYLASMTTDCAFIGFTEAVEKGGPDGKDGFGVTWVNPA